MAQIICNRFDIGFGHVLMTSRNSNVIRQVMVTCKSPSLTSDVGHQPVPSSYLLLLLLEVTSLEVMSFEVTLLEVTITCLIMLLESAMCS